ncbi:MAG: Tyrosyl-tRNA synthetase [Parcubacteria group bacterium Greene1014_20]|nr:MAG: Tyrosyl-tRNA synthetase [Parcubacteria group bacterium Greene0416_36]TSC98781.1 MAG: Tyrosyl-tRNA synthetase [Parcubacteria group bacterium Greene1014_20]TSD06739.1 MAG: Tyrosyl-tRNA synthetase [Parcubacteria group bacterium Greene0714_2]
MDKKQLIEQVLTRGVEKIFPAHDFLAARLAEGKILTLYAGFDPTGPTLHLGHVIQLQKLADFQKLGHKVIFLIGSFTAMIGDPSDKAATRTQLTKEQVVANAMHYREEASKFLDFSGHNPAEIRYNGDWLSKLNFEDVLKLASNFTAQQMMERDMFQKRMEEAKPIYLHEFFYPLMQGYDSVAMDVDGEIGGNDQTFNMLVGRDLMKIFKGKEKFIVALRILTDSDGKKMGKTEGNMVSLLDNPKDMFGKVMSWPDGMIVPALELCTRMPMEEVRQMETDMKKGANPRDSKIRLAHELVRQYYGMAEADRAEAEFKSMFSQGHKPTEMDVFHVGKPSIGIVDLLVTSRLAASKAEAKRLIEQKGVKIDDRVIETKEELIEIPKSGVVLQKGKIHFLSVRI